MSHNRYVFILLLSSLLLVRNIQAADDDQSLIKELQTCSDEAQMLENPEGFALMQALGRSLAVLAQPATSDQEAEVRSLSPDLQPCSSSTCVADEQTEEKSGQDLLAQALTLFQSKRFPEALAMYRSIVTESGISRADCAIAFACIGDMFKSENVQVFDSTGECTNYAESLLNYRNALRLGLSAKSSALAFTHKGRIHFTGGKGVPSNYDKSLKNFNKALAIDELPANFRGAILLNIGDIYLNGDEKVPCNKKLALENYLAALAIDELQAAGRLHVLSNLSDLRRSDDDTVKNLTEARKFIQAALKLLKKVRLPELMLQEYKGKFSKALKDLNKEVNTGHRERRTASSSVSSSSSSSSSSTVLTDDEPATDAHLSQESQDFFTALRRLYETKQYSRAISVFSEIEDALLNTPKELANAYLIIARIYLYGGEFVAKHYENALKYFSLARGIPELSPVNNALTLADMGHIHFYGDKTVSRDRVQARAFYAQAIASQKLNEKALAIVLRNLNRIDQSATNMLPMTVEDDTDSGSCSSRSSSLDYIASRKAAKRTVRDSE